MVFTGNANPGLAEEIAQHLGIQLGAAQVGRFSDGEVTVEIKQNVRARDVYVVQSTCAPTNESLMELLIMVDALKRASAEVYNPLGNVVARLAWSPGHATVDTGSEQLSGGSLDELIAHALGTPIPVQALFAWLQGDPQAVVGWQVDLSRYAQGRINAVREQPLPRASLRVILQSSEN